MCCYLILIRSPITLVSLNRFERKKNIGLALEAFALLKNHPLYRQNRLHLVIAGGYDLKVSENVEHLEVRTRSCLLFVQFCI